MVRLDSLSLKNALDLALERSPLKREREIVTIDRACGRVLAEDLTVRRSLPAFDNSAMDGFALRHEDAGRRLKIVASIYAGDRPNAILKSGECYRIMTGAQVPADADAIVPIEKCIDVTETEVTVPESVRPEQNLRRRGEELAEGERLIPGGTRLEEAHIALLGAQGIMAVTVQVSPRIVVLSTGNEIREPWEAAEEWEIYNANAFGILALLSRYGFEASYGGRIPDDPQETKIMIDSLKHYDVILSSGGISMGAADYLYEAFMINGMEPLFHGVEVKPGRPTMMGVMGRSFVMGMPGNPLATLLNIHGMGIPVLHRMEGALRVHHRGFYARMGSGLRLRGGRSEMVLGQLREGVFFPTRGGRYGSGMLTPFAESDAVAWFDAEVTEIPEGTWIRVAALGDPGRSEVLEILNGSDQLRASRS